MQGGEYGDFRVDGYEIEGLLGAGPTGELWLARHTASHSHIGLKRLHPKDVDAHDEARRIHAVLGMLNHPSLLRVRELLSYGNDELVLVLDRSEGGTLEELLMARPMLDPGETVTIGATIAHALAAIHDHGLVHGDITPESIVFTAEGQPLLTDVGLSGLVERWDVLGTHGYTDPAASGNPEPSGDIYGLAAACYTALSGAPMDPEGQRRPLHQVNPGVPPGLSHAIEAGLQGQPESRPDAAAFAAQLDAAAPRSAVRFPDGGGFPGFPDSRKGGQDPFVIGTGPASGGGQQGGPVQQGGPGQPNAPGQGQPGQTAQAPPPNPLAGIVGPSGPAFTPGAPGTGPGQEGQQATDPQASPYQQPYDPTLGGATGTVPGYPNPDDEDDDEEERSGRGFPVKPLLIGVPSVLGLALVVLVVGLLLPTGGDSSPDEDQPTTAATEGSQKEGGEGDTANEPDRPEPELKGDGNPEKWARVLNELDNRRAKAFETLDKEALENIYAQGSYPMRQDRSFMDKIANPDKSNVEFVGARGVWTMLLSLETVSVTDDRVELLVESKVVDVYYAVLPAGSSNRVDTNAEKQKSKIVLVPDGDGGWLISKDRVVSPDG